MPRRKRNAQKVYKPKKIRSRAVLVRIKERKCEMSPGILVAAAEWRWS